MSVPELPDIPKARVSLAERGSRFLALQLRIFSILQLLAGAGYIAVAVVLQFPPGDPLTLGLWAIGCLAILTAVFGCFGSCRVRCCLGVYVTLAVLALAGQVGLVLYLFIAPGNAEEQLASYQQTKGQIKENLHEIIDIGRWVLLGLLGLQLLAIVLAASLRCCSRHRSYVEFQEEEQAAYTARRDATAEHLDALRAKLGLAPGQLPGEAAGAKGQVVHIHALSGTAAERLAAQQEQQRAMRSSLFEQVDASSKPGDDLEAGRITSRVVTNSEPASSPWDSMPAQPSSSAWPQVNSLSSQRAFKPTWSKAGKP